MEILANGVNAPLAAEHREETPMIKGKQVVALALAGALLASGPGWTQQPAPAQAQGEEEMQPRLIWGIVLKIAMSSLGDIMWGVFKSWLEQKLSTGLESATERIVASVFKRSGASVTPRSAEPLTSRDVVLVGTPSTPLKVEGNSQNYQGVHVGLMMAEPGGQAYRFRPVNAGFRTGERFKLRVVSTFDGEVSIENINPRSERRQIYPPRPSDVVAVKSGQETLIPLGEKEFFEFTGDTGREQLVINIVDPRARASAASTAQVYRQDVSYGSHFLQEVTPSTFPHISQAIELQHAAR